MRLDKLLTELKYTTRRQTQAFLKTHQVYINEMRVLSVSYDVNPIRDKILIDDEMLFYEDPLNIVIYKPKGYLSANHDPLHPCVVDLIQHPYDRFNFKIAGRLDLDSEGLLILTTSGALAHQITSPKYHIDKIYEVSLDRPLLNPNLMLEGVHILDGKNQPFFAKAKKINVEGSFVTMTIDEGKFHQVKRMFEAIDLKVVNLKRIQLGSLKLNSLKPGEYRQFRKEELYE
jgi:16S rRNA pseudouridine516 synthase